MTAIVAVDVDEVVADLMTAWLGLYNTDYHDTVTRADIRGWQAHEFVKPGCGRRLYGYLSRPDLYELVHPVPGALAGVTALRQVARVIFVSSCVTGAYDQKVHWLVRHGFLPQGLPTQHDFIACADKWLVGADYLIDDRSDTIDVFPGFGVLYDAPWNQESQAYRFRWDQVHTFIANEIGVLH